MWEVQEIWGYDSVQVRGQEDQECPSPRTGVDGTSLLNTKSEFLSPTFLFHGDPQRIGRGLPHSRGWGSAPFTADSM